MEEKNYKFWHLATAFVLGAVLVLGVFFAPEIGLQGKFFKNVSTGRPVLNCETEENIGSAVDYFIDEIGNRYRSSQFRQTDGITQPEQFKCHYFIEDKINSQNKYSCTFEYNFNASEHPENRTGWNVIDMEAIHLK